MAQLGDPIDGLSFCWIHHEYETIPKRVYRICFECRHVFTKRSLRRSWRREAPTWRLRLRVRRAKNIWFCPECLHDF